LSRLRLSFDSRLDETFLVSLIVNKVCMSLGMDDVSAFHVELSAVEGFTNAIRHAYHERAGNEVQVLIHCDEQRIDVEIHDCGDSMPSHYVEQLRLGSRVLGFDTTDLQSLPESGMGLELIHQVMDETEYTTAGGVNCLRLTKLRKLRRLAPTPWPGVEISST
jgi:serine/threonine-protein kinase RsbW